MFAHLARHFVRTCAKCDYARVMRTGANQVPMLEKGVVEALLSVLRRHDGSAAVVEKACGALMLIAFSGA